MHVFCPNADPASNTEIVFPLQWHTEAISTELRIQEGIEDIPILRLLRRQFIMGDIA